MKIELTNPLALVLLGLIPLVLYLARNSLAALSKRRRAASIGVRIAIILLVVLALAGLRLNRSSNDLALIFVIDVSASVAPSEQPEVIAFINEEIDRAGPRDYIGVVAFGREALVEVSPTRKEVLNDWRLSEISSTPARDYTNIAGALRLAAALVPEAAVGRLVLISDGNENLESALEESQVLKAGGTEVFARSMRALNESGAKRGEVAVRELAVPEMPAEAEAFDLKATIDTTRDSDAILRVFRNDTVVAERSVRLSADAENVFVLPQRLDEKGFYTYRAEIESTEDGFLQNNSRDAFSLVEGRPRILYVHGDDGASAGLKRVLTEASLAADIRSAAGIPKSLAGFQNYDLVILDNVPATALALDQMKMLQSYVRDLGGGFMMIGGDQSFGPGGYFKTPIEETLPVSLDVRQKKHFPSLGLSLVVDKSGSMMGSKMDLALEAASAAVDFLSERDWVQVIGFDDSAHDVVKLTQVEDKKAITREIRSIQASGGTNIYSGLEMAHASLAASEAQIKHIILLSDGQSEGRYDALIRSLNEAGITLSSVAIGEDADLGLMRMLAERGGGRFYETGDASNLPRIFTREAVLASRSTIIEEPFVPRLVRTTRAAAGIDWPTAPQLGGYVGTAERDSIQSPAITSLVTDKDDPLYAVWQYGLGRAAAFTSDVKPNWASGWMNWPGFGQFWTQAIRDAVRLESAGDLIPRVEIAAGRGRIIVEAPAPDGGFRNGLRLRGRVVGPDFSTEDISLYQTAAGRYEAEFAATRRGAYLVSITEEGGRSAPVAGAVNSYSPEFAIASSDEGLLARVAEETGGRVLGEQSGSDVESLFSRRATKAKPAEIWETLLLIALLLLPLDVGLRRMHITGEQVSEARAWIEQRLWRREVIEVDHEGAAALAQLKDARTRVKLSDESPGVASATGSQPASPFIENRPARDLSKSPATPVNSQAAESENAPAVDHTPLASRLLKARREKRD